MRIIGLTGSIATGKSTVSTMLRSLGIPVFDADAYVHALMQYGSESFEAIKHTFPEAIQDNIINRKALGGIVYEDEAKMQKLEAILHPKVRAGEMAFIRRNRQSHKPLLVLDIPLLFETGADMLCDEVWVTYCPTFMQQQRLMQRPGMSETRMEQILARQMPQEDKCRLADAVIPTSLGKGFTMNLIKRLVKENQYA